MNKKDKIIIRKGICIKDKSKGVYKKFINDNNKHIHLSLNEKTENITLITQALYYQEIVNINDYEEITEQEFDKIYNQVLIKLEDFKLRL